MQTKWKRKNQLETGMPLNVPQRRRQSSAKRWAKESSNNQNFIINHPSLWAVIWKCIVCVCVCVVVFTLSILRFRCRSKLSWQSFACARHWLCLMLSRHTKRRMRAFASLAYLFLCAKTKFEQQSKQTKDEKANSHTRTKSMSKNMIMMKMTSLITPHTQDRNRLSGFLQFSFVVRTTGDGVIIIHFLPSSLSR